MNELRRALALLAVLLATMGGCATTASAQAPPATTTVQDTIYNASGAPASGTVLVSWSAFTTAGGAAIPAGSTSVTLGAGGALSIALAPNAGATPMGSYYTAVFHLSDGTTSRQYWVVPVAVPGGGPAKLAAIENQVLPTSVAMQTVSKQYVDNAIAAAAAGFPTGASPYVQKAGDTMTGPLALSADPVNPNQAADKHYVDASIAGIVAGGGSGTMSAQNANAVAITGGTINSTAIGGTTPAAGSFTTVAATTSVTAPTVSIGIGSIYNQGGSFTVTGDGSRNVVFGQPGGSGLGVFVPTGTTVYLCNTDFSHCNVQFDPVVGSLFGPATAPAGSCTVNGEWVLSQDGHATACISGTWTTKI